MDFFCADGEGVRSDSEDGDDAAGEDDQDDL